MPTMLAGADFRAVVGAVRAARASNGGMLWGLGAHVIKTGLAPVLIDLMERGFISAIAMNGAGIIHDFEVALSGATSEEVEDALGPGRFGMAEETGTLLNAAINQGVAAGKGIGQAVGERLLELSPRHGALPPPPTRLSLPRTNIFPTVGTPGCACGATARRPQFCMHSTVTRRLPPFWSVVSLIAGVSASSG